MDMSVKRRRTGRQELNSSSKRPTKDMEIICGHGYNRRRPYSRPFMNAVVVWEFEQSDICIGSDKSRISARKEVGKGIADANIDQRCDPICWENSRGLGILERMQIMKDNRISLKADGQD